MKKGHVHFQVDGEYLVNAVHESQRKLDTRQEKSYEVADRNETVNLRTKAIKAENSMMFSDMSSFNIVKICPYCGRDDLSYSNFNGCSPKLSLFSVGKSPNSSFQSSFARNILMLCSPLSLRFV